MSDPVSVAVAGCGWWATAAHLPALRDDPRARLAAVADPDPGKRRRAVDGFQAARAFAGWEEMLDAGGIEALVVATPPGLHFAPAAAALERGIHVLVEKPLVVDPAEGARLVAMAERSGAQLAVGYTFHHTPHVAALREAVAAGAIGAVEHVSCLFASTARELYRGMPAAYGDGTLGFQMAEVPGARTYSDPSAGGGQAHSQLTHGAALVLHLCDLVPARVSAFVSGFELEVDLADALAVEFEGGAVGSLDSVGSVLPGQSEILECRVFGDAGHVEISPLRGTASIHGPGGETTRLDRLPEADRYPLHAPVRNLVGLAIGTAPNLAPGLLGQRVVALTDAALRSSGEGRAISVAPPEH